MNEGDGKEDAYDGSGVPNQIRLVSLDPSYGSLWHNPSVQRLRRQYVGTSTYIWQRGLSEKGRHS